MYIWWWPGCLIWLSHSVTVQPTCITTFAFLDNFQWKYCRRPGTFTWQNSNGSTSEYWNWFFSIFETHVPANLLSLQMPDASHQSCTKMHWKCIAIIHQNYKHPACTCMHSKHCLPCSKNAVAATAINIVHIFSETLKTKNVQKLFHGSFL